MDEIIETSIAVKKCWIAPIAADGGCGTDWMEMQIGQREGTLKFGGSAAATTPHKGVTGNTLARTLKKGEYTLGFQLADMSTDIIAMLTGGTSEATADGDEYSAPLEENQDIEYSFRILSASGVLYTLPRVAIDAYPMVSDDDLHYYTMDGSLITPAKKGVAIYKFTILNDVAKAAAAITAFAIAGFVATATITPVAKTVAISLPSGTSPSTLVPLVTTSQGSSITPITGVSTDFTSPVVYTVTAVDGTEAEWTVTVTILP